ncbi:ABC-type transport auxiliary lipoprotein family protein [Asticcacaulis taihuensis]|uniref:Cholesterol transport system auxiliary component n=2 Tax=Asticcacaulis taihuensis TaxID=260084 RepID=A0A1G4Q5W8_9CAUL|nr:ABC-type transport auxiliary lipoprotein family protein [Asticcacaulis taihuensis]SCW39825.1 cholesterol transport system auxiliary component [Asticcacaulis taihuensis]
MSALMKTVKVAALASAALALSGCVTLLPKTKPAQLYRFGYTPELVEQKAEAAGTAGRAVGMAPTGIVFGTVTFPQDSAGDRIVTVEGSEVAYVAEARWTSAASGLFKDAISTGFARGSQTVTLEPRGPTAANFRLDISVRKFETDYKRNRPTVSVALDARLIRLSDRVVVGQKFISADIPVRKSDMSLMADGYNQATTQVVTSLIDFSEDALANYAQTATPQEMAKPSATQKVEGL